MSATARIPVLGGTAFVGRAKVEAALRSGAEVTLFGAAGPGAGLFPDVTRFRGDRDTGHYAALREGAWDAVVDVSGYVPRHVGQAKAGTAMRVSVSCWNTTQEDIDRSVAAVVACATR